MSGAFSEATSRPATSLLFFHDMDIYAPFDSVLHDTVFVQESLSVQEAIEILLVHDDSFSAVQAL